MKGKLFSLSLLTVVVLLALVSATLTNTPSPIPDTATFGTSLNKTITQTLTINNSDVAPVSGTLTESGFVYSSISFTSTGLTLTFNPAALTVPASGSATTIANIAVPYDAYMGLYTNLITLSSETFTLSTILKSSDYSKNLRFDIDEDSYPASIRAGSDFIIKKDSASFIENRNNDDDAQDVEIEAWLYDTDDNEIVSKDSFNIGRIRKDNKEELDENLELDTTGLNPDHDFDLYMRAYSNSDPENFFVEKRIDTIDVKSEEDLCEAGDLEVDDLDEDDIRFHGDKISPGEKIIVPVAVTNTGSDTINDVRVRAWICEDDSDCTWDDEHLDDYNVPKLSAQDLGSDDDYTFEIPLEVPDNADDGDYRLRVEAYESSEEDSNCFGADTSIEIEKEDEELIITDVTMPEILACGEDFTSDVRLENIGDDDLEDIVIKVFDQSNKLGINKLSDSFDLDSDKSKRQTFSLKIPAGASEGDYTFVIAISNGDEDSVQKIVKVQGGCVAPAPKVSVSASLEGEAVAGSQATIKATISNTGTETSTYTIKTSGNEEWSTSKIEPSSLTLDAGKSADALIYLDLNEDASGTKEFDIQVTSAGQITEQPVSLTIQAKTGFSITGSSILGNLKGNWFIWVIVAINVILIVAIIIVASKLSK